MQDWLLPTNVEGEKFAHIFVTGQTRQGKSTTLMKIATSAFENRNFKIFDLNSGQKGEGQSYCLPSSLPYWKKPREDDVTGKMISAKGYPHKILYPYNSMLPKKLPSVGQPFCIPVNDITTKDLQALLGMEIKYEAKVLRVIQDSLSKKSTALDFLKLIESATKGKEIKLKSGAVIPPLSKRGRGLIELGLAEFLSEKTLCSGKCKMAIDLEKEIKGKWITTSETSLYNEEYVNFFVYYFLRKIREINKKLKKTIIIVMREAQDFIPRNVLSVKEAATKELIKEILTKGIAYGIYFILDAQSPSFIDEFGDQFGITMCHRLKRVIDVDNIGEKFWVAREMKKTIMRLKPYHAVTFLPAGWRYGYIEPPRCKVMASGEDFFSLWKRSDIAKMQGQYAYTDYRDQIAEVEDEYRRYEYREGPEAEKKLVEVPVPKKYKPKPKLVFDDVSVEDAEVDFSDMMV